MRSVSLLREHRGLLLAACIFFITSLRAQGPSPVEAGNFIIETFKLAPGDSAVSLRHRFIIPGTETVLLDTVRLRSGVDYSLDARTGLLTVHRTGTPRPLIVSVRYQALPFSFKEVYTHREAAARPDSAARISASKAPGGFSFDQIFGSNLQKSGSIARGITVGSNRDLSLNSGFRMQMAGNLTDDVEVVAALTDENSPIQPEGTTRTLQEVDKVFIELRGTHLSATLGDFNLGLSGTEFGRLNRKLQGAKGRASYRGGNAEGDVLVAGALARGKYATNQFDGKDGVQGPYRLTGQHNERDIIVIAGTERVYVNGERMTRGESADYIIDYAVAEITFTPTKLISRVSRIVVDFEYTDRQFNRSLLAFKSENSFSNHRLTVNASALEENDNEDSPIDITLSDSDKAILRSAGNDRLKAVRSGAVLQGPGKGQYIRKDTTVASPSGPDTSLSIYRFSPSDTAAAVYSVTFSYVGSGKGDYDLIAAGRYQFAGLGKGSYLPIRFLPMPSAHRFADLSVGGQLTGDLKLEAEYAFSNFDPNRFSEIDDENNSGSAANVSLHYDQKELRIGGHGLGSIEASLKERFIDHRYVSPDRANEVEFNRKWNILDSSSRDEELREGSFAYRPVPVLSLAAGLGWMRRGEPYVSRRYTASASVSGERIPRATYEFELIRSRDAFVDDDGTWFRHRGLAEYAIGSFTPGISYNGEVLRSRALGTDTLNRRSFRFHELGPRLGSDSLGSMSVHAELLWRWADSLSSGLLKPASRSLTQSYNWQLRDWNSLASSLTVTFQNKVFLEPFRRPGESDVQTVLVRSQTRFNPGHAIESDWFYELSTEQTARPERVYQQVPKGTGNYVYLGDVNGNHIVDDADFRLTRFDGDFISVIVPTGLLIPVTDLKASSRIRLNGGRLFKGHEWFENVLGALSSETYLRVDEKSSEADKKQIYLLHLSHFLNDQTTIAGSDLITQDLYLLENRPEFSMRFRYSRRKGLTQYALTDERTYADERSMRIRWQLVKEFSNQTDLTEKKDNLSSQQVDYRARNIVSRAFSTDWAYRPEQSVELGIRVSVGEAVNFDTATARLNTESARLVYSLSEKGQAKGELGREEVLLHRAGVQIPFELTEGRVGGKSWLWHFSFDYRMTQFLQSTISYDGRSEGGSPTVHTAKAEVRAFF
ncbi:MAG TPA: hypothetical protein VES59_09895 [Bacteroidota bacterium]|nr:hypothetical protein [Bacteroidota bacterium]